MLITMPHEIPSISLSGPVPAGSLEHVGRYQLIAEHKVRKLRVMDRTVLGIAVGLPIEIGRST